MKVIGYLSGWAFSRLAGRGCTINDIKLNELTACIFSGCYVASATNPTLKYIAGINNLKSMVTACHAKGCKVVLSLYDGSGGGGEYTSDYLLSILKSSTLRGQLVNNLYETVRWYYIDGININWESTNRTRELSDQLITELYAVLNPMGKSLSLSLNNNNTIYKFASPEIVNQYVDWMDIQYYNEFTWADVEDQIKVVTDAGYTKEKLCPGTIFQVKDGSEDYIMPYFDLVEQIKPNFDQSVAKVIRINSSFRGNNYLVNGTLTWQGLLDLQYKVDWLKNNGYGGIMVFDVSQDMLKGHQYSMLETIYNRL